MYRRPAAQGPLHGVGGGVYAGGPRVVDAGKLPRAARQRLADVLSGRGEPSPIAHDRPAGLPSSVRAVWGAVMGVVILVTTFTVGFDDASSRWELQPRVALLVYVLGAGLLAFSLLAVLRRRFLVGGSELRPGRYLLPLDIVDVAVVDRRGRQLVTVTPLGDARDALVRGEGRKAELVVVFEDTSQIVFPLRADPGGTVTLRRLEHAQRLLEDLTYAHALDRALSHDPFFELRVDRSWSSVAPTDEDAPPSLRTKRSLSAGRGGPAVAAGVATLLAFGSFAARNALGDRLMFERALRSGTPEAFERYMVKGVRWTRAAQAERDRILAAREEAARAEAKKKQGPGHGPPATPRSCLDALRAQASPSHPNVPRLMEAIVAYAQSTGDATIPVRFDRRMSWREGEALRVDERLAAREGAFAWAFERVFSEACPASVVRFRIPKDNELYDEPFGLFVGYDIADGKRTWTVPHREHGKDITLHGVEVVFDVRLSAPRGGGRETFRLTMPPPDRPSMALRPRSIFRDLTVDDGTFDERAYDAMAARAFDRLYDEVYGLFFDGDPRVPLHTTAGVDDF